MVARAELAPSGKGSLAMKCFVAAVALIGVGYLLMPMFGLDRDLPVNAQERDQFAGNRGPVAVEPAKFDGKRAIGYLKEICAIGPRMSATVEMKKQQELIRKHF